MRNPRLHQPSSSYLILSHRPFSLHTSIDIAQRTGNASSHHHIASSDFANVKETYVPFLTPLSFLSPNNPLCIAVLSSTLELSPLIRLPDRGERDGDKIGDDGAIADKLVGARCVEAVLNLKCHTVCSDMWQGTLDSDFDKCLNCWQRLFGVVDSFLPYCSWCSFVAIIGSPRSEMAIQRLTKTERSSIS